MLTSFVVRLSAAALDAGALAGEVEHVQTGERGEFRDADELQAWCVRLMPAVLPVPGSTAADLNVLPFPSVDPGELP